MCTTVFQYYVYVILFVRVFLSECVTVNKLYDTPNFTSKTKVELKPLFVRAGLGDIAVISAPIVNNNTYYYLSKPNADSFRLYLDTNEVTIAYKNTSRNNDEYNDIVVKYIKGDVKAIITPINNYKIFNLNDGNISNATTNDVFGKEESGLKPNDFMIGPLGEDDHGNWVLSAYYQSSSGEWIELFQVISMEITEYIPTVPYKPRLNPGETLEVSFAYPIKNLESCEIIAPRSTFDRFYDRDRRKLDYCGFRVPNVTKDDEGLWTIVGVASIVYEANIFLKVNKVL